MDASATLYPSGLFTDNIHLHRGHMSFWWAAGRQNLISAALGTPDYLWFRGKNLIWSRRPEARGGGGDKCPGGRGPIISHSLKKSFSELRGLRRGDIRLTAFAAGVLGDDLNWNPVYSLLNHVWKFFLISVMNIYGIKWFVSVMKARACGSLNDSYESLSFFLILFSRVYAWTFIVLLLVFTFSIDILRLIR